MIRYLGLAPDQAGCEGVKVYHSGEMEALVHGLLFSTVTVTKAQYIDDRIYSGDPIRS